MCQFLLPAKQKQHWSPVMWSCHPTLPRPGWAGATLINSLLVAHLGPRGVTGGFYPLNGLPLCHCLLTSVYSLEDIDCITISHHAPQSLKLTCHTELIGLCERDKGRLVGSWTQKANTMYGFLNNTKAGEERQLHKWPCYGADREPALPQLFPDFQ